jgi:thiol-disulfide isomerase/thioredoxin
LRNRPSATFVILSGLLMSLSPLCRAEVEWRTDFAVARQAAKRAGKPLLVDFSATWCGPCREMERTTFQNRGVEAQMARCICVRVDIDREPGLAKQFGINSIPRIIAVDSRGKRMLDSLGYREPSEFRSMLASALSGKPVLESGGQPDHAPPDIAALESHVQAKDFASWRASQPAASGRALRAAVEQLGAFEANERAKSGAILGALGDAGIQALIDGLFDARLSVRVGAYDTLTKLLLDRYRAAPASIPRYDPWGASAERVRMAQGMRQWWQRRAAHARKAL